jgi:hypothetical protein
MGSCIEQTKGSEMWQKLFFALLLLSKLHQLRYFALECSQ